MVIITLHQIKNVILFVHTVLVFLSPTILCLVMSVDCLQHPWVQVVKRQTVNAAITQSCHVASWFICCTVDNCGLPPQYTHHPFTCKHTFKKLEKKYYGICITESIQAICYQTKGLGLPLIDSSYRYILVLVGQLQSKMRLWGSDRVVSSS